MKRAAAALAATAILAAPAPAIAARNGAVGREWPVAAPLRIADTDHQSNVQVAAGDPGFFAVWEETIGCCSQAIYGALLDQEARPLDPIGIAVSGEDAYEPRVAWSGRDYVVVWELESSIGFARVAPDGEVLDAPPRSLPSPGRSSFAPDVASTGNGSLVVWSGCSPTPGDCEVDLYGAMIQRDGEVRGPFPIVAAAGRQGSPSVAAGAGGYLVTWESNTSGSQGLHAMRLDETGVPAGPPVLLGPGFEAGADVAFSGGQFLVAWTTRNAHDLDVTGIRLTSAGAPIDEARPIAFGEAVQWEVGVAADRDGGWFVVWEDRQEDREVYGAHVSAAGIPATVNGRRISEEVRADQSPAVAFDGSVRTIVWAAGPPRRDEEDDAYAVAERADGAVGGAAHPIAMDFNIQVGAQAAFNGEVFLVVWEDDRGGWPWDVYGARVTASGRMLDGSGFRIAAPRGGAFVPTVATDGTEFLVVWEDWRNYDGGDRRTDVYGALVLADGTVVERDIPISTARDYQQNVELAWTGSSYLAVWEDARSGPVGQFSGHADLYGTAISSRGRVGAPGGRPIATGRRNHGSHDVATGRGRAVVSWTAGCHAWREEECRRDVFATRVTAGGRPVGERLKIARTKASESYPTGMLGPRGYYVVWLESNGGRLRLMGRGLRSDGRLTRPRLVMRPGGDELYDPELAWTGTFGLLLWNEWADGIDADRPPDPLALRLSAEGRRLHRTPFRIAPPDARASASDTTGGPRGCAAVVYSRAFEPPRPRYRTFLKLVGPCRD